MEQVLPFTGTAALQGLILIAFVLVAYTQVPTNRIREQSAAFWFTTICVLYGLAHLIRPDQIAFESMLVRHAAIALGGHIAIWLYYAMWRRIEKRVRIG